MSYKKYSVSEQSILTTVLYSDIFSFPLTKEEIWRFLIAEKKIPRNEFEKSLQTVSKYLSNRGGYYCLKKREKIITRRTGNLAEVEKKQKKAYAVAKKLARLSSILFIGISGGLASGNVSASDDIDLVIITKKDTLFVTRLLILVLLELYGVRRHRTQRNTADTICVNLLFDETAIHWFRKQQDIYTAREIAQIIPVIDKEGTFHKFINANKWIYKFLPNFNYKKNDQAVNNYNTKTGIDWLVYNPVLETISRVLQMSYMQYHRTNEVITRHFLAFHPKDYRTQTIAHLRLKVRQLGLLTKF